MLRKVLMVLGVAGGLTLGTFWLYGCSPGPDANLICSRTGFVS